MSTFPGPGSLSPHWGRVTQGILPWSTSANWGGNKIFKVKAMTSVAGRGPTEIVFIFCHTRAIYSSPGITILTEQPEKHHSSHPCSLHYFALFFPTSEYNIFSDLGKTLLGPLFPADKSEWALGKKEGRLGSIIAPDLQVVDFRAHFF